MRYEVARRNPQAEATFGIRYLVEKVDAAGERWLLATFTDEVAAQQCLQALRRSEEARDDHRG